MNGRYLFGVDLEDPRFIVPGGENRPPRLPELTEPYLGFLRRHRAKATFFIVGDVARAYPDFVRALVGEGHEIACHSDRHLPLTSQDRAAFRGDVLNCLDALAAADAEGVRGYRAPSFSLTAETRWAHDVLGDLGFLYSSSVLPARNPHFGWPGFGTAPRLVSGVVEMPMTLVHPRLLPLPLGGGVYFRVLPKPLLRRAFAAHRGKAPVTGYLHPADIDVDSEPVRYPGVGRAGNWLLRQGRGGVMARLDMVAKLGFSFEPYGPEAERLRAQLNTPGAALA
jgi:polysaccharide deacetylase family protein (PEP-CTERM system associated)